MNSTAAPAKRATKTRYIPPEIVEKILLNLRGKPLLRFSSVSKSWNSMIFGSQFVKKHSCRAAVLGRERIFMQHFISNLSPSSFPLSAVSSQAEDSDAPLVFPFCGTTSIKAFCHEILCLQDWNDKSLKLWNPTMRQCFLLPQSSSDNEYVGSDGWPDDYIYGLGYDAAADDYKILKVSLERFMLCAAELYSLRSNSWKKIKPYRRDTPLRSCCSMCVFLGGAFHWILSENYLGLRVIISFDHSTEEYGELALPPELDKSSCAAGMMLTVLKGMLCLSLNYSSWSKDRYVLWMMEDYGVVESWKKKVDIGSNLPCFKRESGIVMPFYLFEDGRFLVGLFGGMAGRLILAHLQSGREKQEEWVFLSEDEETSVTKHVQCHHSFDRVSEFFVYVESLVSPAMWAGQRSGLKAVPP